MKQTDPVCGMQVPEGKLQIEYLDMKFAFCSEQCRERFQANPGLYVGKAGMKSITQAGHEVLKCRRIHLDDPLPETVADALQESLYAMMGIKQVNFQGDTWEITYDLLQATAAQIERTIIDSGAKLGKAWMEKFRRAFVHYLEETELQNLEQVSGTHSHHH